MSKQLFNIENRHSLVVCMANMFESFLTDYLDERYDNTIQNSNTSFTKKRLYLFETIDHGASDSSPSKH